jgi:branched-chain amino acid transport system ATP-binding protein
MSVADNLLLGSYSRRHLKDHGRSADLEAIYGRFPRLRERRTQLAGTLSGGERQMLANRSRADEPAEAPDAG